MPVIKTVISVYGKGWFLPMPDTPDVTFLFRKRITETTELINRKYAVKKPVNPVSVSLFGCCGLVGRDRGDWEIRVNLLVVLIYSTSIFKKSGTYGWSGDIFFSTASTTETWSLEIREDRYSRIQKRVPKIEVRTTKV